MSGPVIGVGRITIPYTIGGFDHELRMYVSEPTLTGSDWHIGLHPTIGGTSVWTAAAQGLADAMGGILPSGATYGTTLLEEYDVVGWLPRDTFAITPPTLTGSAVFGSQTTLTLRALDFTRPKIVLMEGNQVAPVAINTPTSGAGGMDTFIDPFLGTSSVSSRPWAFMTTMHGIFLLVNDFVRAKVTFNDKLVRLRGL